MNFFCFGLNHHTAPIEARERFAGHARSPAVLRDLGCSEVLLLTTCNRVEIYAAAGANIANEEIAESLRINDEPSSKNDLEAFYRKENAECARHLFRVAAGLDSMVVGETEIFGQAKRAYADARASGNAGPLLHRLCQRAFRAAKQVRSKTQITRGPVSVGSVAVDLAEKIFGDLRGRKVLVLGAGETSAKTLRALASRGVPDLRVNNRTPAREEEMAKELEGITVPFATWLEQSLGGEARLERLEPQGQIANARRLDRIDVELEGAGGLVQVHPAVGHDSQARLGFERRADPVETDAGTMGSRLSSPDIRRVNRVFRRAPASPRRGSRRRRARPHRPGRGG